MKNLKVINITESNFEKEYEKMIKKYNIETSTYAEKYEEVPDYVIAVEHKGRSYVTIHIDIYNNEEDPNAPYNSYYNEYFQLYINGRKASGANDFNWFEYNMSNDYQIVPKTVQKILIKNICNEEIKIVEHYRNKN